MESWTDRLYSKPIRRAISSPPFSRGIARLSIGRQVGSFFFVPVFGNGFSIRQPAWIRLAGMLEAHGSLLFRDKEWSFLVWGFFNSVGPPRPRRRPSSRGKPWHSGSRSFAR